MKSVFRRLLMVCGLVALGLSAAGCADEYSAAVSFKVRTDPLFRESPDTLITTEFAVPDQPGQLPLINVKQMDDPRNPFFTVPADVRKKIDANTFNPRDLSQKHKDEFQDGLAKLFGTPQQPKISEDIGEEEQITKLKLEPEQLVRGSLLYRAQCLTCHGLTGDGRGPTAPWVNPHPRDYRLGKFKFQSVDQSDGKKRKPLREDLFRTLNVGVEGTSMPAFSLLPPEDLEALVSYVIFLSIRGETEYQTMKRGLQSSQNGLIFSTDDLGEGITGTLDAYGKLTVAQWVQSQSHAIPDSKYPYDGASEKVMLNSVQRGYAMFAADANRFKKYLPKGKYAKIYPQMFQTDKAKSTQAIKDFVGSVSCIKCHYYYGKRALFSMDEWGTMRRPANLTTGVFRGGRRPIDLYWRIHSGINGSGMLSYKNLGMNEEQIWDLVNFIRALPYPAMREQYKIDFD